MTIELSSSIITTHNSTEPKINPSTSSSFNSSKRIKSASLVKRSAKSKAIEALTSVNKLTRTSLANATANKSTVDLFDELSSNDLEELEDEDDTQESRIGHEASHVDLKTNAEEEPEVEEDSRLFHKKRRSSTRTKSGSSDLSNASSRLHSHKSHIESATVAAGNEEEESDIDADSKFKTVEKYRLRKQSSSSNRSTSKVDTHVSVPHKKARLASYNTVELGLHTSDKTATNDLESNSLFFN